MALDHSEQAIKRVLVVDDDPDARESFSLTIEDSGLEAVLARGPLQNLQATIELVQGTADAVFSDFRLTPRAYSAFDGDRLVAACYKVGIPAVLCTTYPDTEFLLDRQLVRYIPVLLQTSTPHPEEIREAFRTCRTELEQGPPPSRTPWRTLVRVHEVDTERDLFYAVLPGWSAREKVLIHLSSVPEPIRARLKPGMRLHAQANIGAETHGQLYILDWEAD